MSAVLTVFQYLLQRMLRLWPSLAEPVWLRFISWPETLAMLKCSPVLALPSVSIISKSVKRLLRFMWPLMMAVKALKVWLPSCCAAVLKRWISRSWISWFSITVALRLWCMPRRKYSVNSVAMIRSLVRSTI